MASVAQRASLLLSHNDTASPDEDESSSPEELTSNLERTIDKIGMGWALPMVIVSSVWICSMFCGMMLGAVGWGSCSDLLGRTMAFNATLLFTSLFGICASTFAGGVKSLCISLFFLGSAVGGSMPTDGTLFLENIPRGKQYLLTLLSVFFSFGAVLSAVIGLLVIPANSCPLPPAACDTETQNLGWRYLLTILSVMTLAMFLGRFILFRLYESPRYLVHTGRPAAAVHALKKITKFNGQTMSLDMKDVSATPRLPSVVFEMDDSPQPSSLKELPPIPDLKVTIPPSISYQSTASQSEPPLPGDYTFQTPVSEDNFVFRQEIGSPLESSILTPQEGAEWRRPAQRPGRRSRGVSFAESVAPAVEGWFTEWVLRPGAAWWKKMVSLLTPEWRRSTVLVWVAWTLMSLAYTIFNVFLPKLLESTVGDANPHSRKRAMWDVVTFTLGGCPGSLLGAWMIETKLGRRKSLALSTFATAFFCAVFAAVSSQAAVTASSMAISLTATTMWAVLYGMTPEIFPPHIRGTACGTASALSRIGGMIAPLLGGQLLVIDRRLPVYAAVVIFIVAGFSVLLLPSERAPTTETRRGDGYQLVD
ncbi:hypothetical protein FRB98_001431 [Tulasnella sp. 332]|nr:hypothetical protein FRB98_001431 [Tulasnella sp. 332]